MTSQIGYLKLLITRCILSGPLDFEIKRVACIFFFFSYLDYHCLIFFIYFVFNNIKFWKPFGISSVMICWLSNGRGHWCGGVVGRGVDFEIKIWKGGGSLKNWRVYQKIAQPSSQLINNDRPLSSSSPPSTSEPIFNPLGLIVPEKSVTKNFDVENWRERKMK